MDGHHGLALAADDGMVIAASDNTLKWLTVGEGARHSPRPWGAEAITELSTAMDQPGLVAYRTDRVNVLSPTGATLLGTGLAPGLGGGLIPPARSRSRGTALCFPFPARTNGPNLRRKDW